MKSFKEIAEDLQKQAETFGIKDFDIRNLFAELILEISEEISKSEEYRVNLCLLKAYAHLRTLKNKEDETKENNPG